MPRARLPVAGLVRHTTTRWDLRWLRLSLQNQIRRGLAHAVVPTLRDIFNRDVDEPVPLRDAPFAFMDLLDATAGHGTSFSISGESVRYACRACGCTFEQTDEGWRLLREHEMEHGAASTADLSELDGRTLRIVTWATRRDSLGTRAEVWGIDDERGVAYCLSNAYQAETVWKWRINTSTRSGALACLNAATPSDRG